MVLHQKWKNMDSNSWSSEVIKSKCILLQPLEHSNYRQGAKRFRWAHLLVFPTGDWYATCICSTAVFLWLPGLIYQINRTREKLWKCSGDVNGAVMWQGHLGWKGQRTPHRNAPCHPPKFQPPARCPEGTGEGRKARSKLSTFIPPIPLISGYFCAHSCVTILALSCVKSSESYISQDMGDLQCTISRGIKNRSILIWETTELKLLGFQKQM